MCAAGALRSCWQGRACVMAANSKQRGQRHISHQAYELAKVASERRALHASMHAQGWPAWSLYTTSSFCGGPTHHTILWRCTVVRQCVAHRMECCTACMRVWQFGHLHVWQPGLVDGWRVATGTCGAVSLLKQRRKSSYIHDQHLVCAELAVLLGLLRSAARITPVVFGVDPRPARRQWRLGA